MTSPLELRDPVRERILEYQVTFQCAWCGDDNVTFTRNTIDVYRHACTRRGSVVFLNGFALAGTRGYFAAERAAGNARSPIMAAGYFDDVDMGA